MSVTLKAVLLDRGWKEDKTNFVRVRVTHKRKTRFIKTHISVHKEDLGRTGAIRTVAIEDEIRDLVKRMRAVTNAIDMYDLKIMSVDDVVEKINEGLKKEEKFRLDFVAFGHQVAAKKSAGTASSYIIALNALERFFGHKPDISEISVRNLRAFEEFIRNEKVIKVNRITGERKESKRVKKGRAASLYLSNVRHIYKCARIEFNDPDKGLFPIPVDPFEYFSVPKTPASRHRHIPVETIQLMIDTRKSLKGRQRMAVDAFLISFGLCGMNLVDMYTCGKPKKNGVLFYTRTKTANRRDDNAEMHVKIHPQIKKIMKDYLDSERCFNYYRTYSRRDSLTTAVNVELKRWADANKQDSFTFYAARHSWATIGRSKLCKIDSKVITAGLCHIDESARVDDIYVDFDWELLWEAQKTILDVFDWE